MSEVSWPDGWRRVPLWSLFRRVKDVGHPDEQMLSVYRDHGVVTKDDRTDNFNKTAENRNIYQLVDRDWLIVNRMKAWQGSVGVSTHRGIVSGHYICFEPRHHEDSRFLNLLLRSDVYRAEFVRLSRGVRPSQIEIDNDDLRALDVWLPPRQGQQAIADFLDRETARIDALIAAKRRLAELIDLRVTVAVDDYTARLPVAVPLKRVANIAYGLGQPPQLAEVGVPIIRATNINRGSISSESMIYASSENVPWTRCAPLTVGELLVVRSGALTGDSAAITEAWAGAAPGYDLRVTPRAINPQLLAQQFLGRAVLDQIDLAKARAAQPHLNAEDVGDVLVRVGSASEEREVAQQLTDLRQGAERMGSILNRQIELLAERRQALITAAVTGQLEIPGVAA